MTLFHPLIQPKNRLSGVQKFLLRVILGQAGKTLFYGVGSSLIVEVLETHEALRQFLPLVHSDLSESNAQPFWVPRRLSDQKRFNLERHNKSRRHRTIGVVSGDSRPKFARRQSLRSSFPSPDFVRKLVTELGYDRDAAIAALAQPRRFNGRPDRRRKIAIGGADEQAERSTNRDYQRLDYGNNLYVPVAPIRHTLTGGGFTEKQVSEGLLKMRTDARIKTALNEIVYRRRSTLDVSNETGIPVEVLYVYASRLRKKIRQKSQPMAA